MRIATGNIVRLVAHYAVIALVLALIWSPMVEAFRIAIGV